MHRFAWAVQLFESVCASGDREYEDYAKNDFHQLLP